jgi:hypothetical protein
MSNSLASGKLRQLHLLLGLFFTPAIMFFSISGTLQTFQMHEAHDDYVAAPAIAAMATVHKEQVIDVHAFDPRPADAPPPRKHPGQKLVPMKWFVLFMAIGLIMSQLTGIALAIRYKRERIQMAAALVLGTIVPIAILQLQ